jgi:signal transduction histidine kinase
VTRRRRALIALAIAASGYALGGEWASTRHPSTENHLLDATVGLSYFAAGIVALDRKPGNRTGPLLVAYGVAWFLGNWSNLDLPVLPVLGFVGGAVSTAFLAHVALGYPTGRLRTRFERLTLVGVYAVSFGTSAVILVTWDPRTVGCQACPWEPALFPSGTAFEAAFTLNDRSGIVLAPMFLGAVVLRWLRASPAERRDLTPLWIATSLLATAYLVDAFVTPVDEESFSYLLWQIRAVLEIAVPVVFLWGLLSRSLARTAVGDLVLELERPLPAEDLRAALSKALGDPSLDVAYAIDQDPRWVDATGEPVTLPTGDAERRSATIVRRDAEPVAALVHDAALDPALVRAVGAAAGMAIANERLRAEVRAQLTEVQASRQRIVEAGDRERRRVERDLHDGAQQRLVTLAVSLAMLREHGTGDLATDTALGEASEELRQALRELRELARGIHPAILTEEGLGAAVESLAQRAAPSVCVRTDLGGRLPAPVEATAYFVVSEALTNVAKYARATRTSVDLQQRAGSLHLEVADDGVGGADVQAGSGLRGLTDRVAALGGSLRVESPPGAGTRVVVEIPLDE